MYVVQSSFSTSGRGVTEENIAIAKSYLADCFQFDSLNGSSELKFVSELRFCRYLKLIGRLSSERCICAWIAFTFENTDLNVLRI